MNGNYKGFRAAYILISNKKHLIVFEAEKTRINDTVERIDNFFESYGIKNN